MCKMAEQWAEGWPLFHREERVDDGGGLRGDELPGKFHGELGNPGDDRERAAR